MKNKQDLIPPDEQLGTSLGMSGERPTAIPSVGEHEVQHESTDCWEFCTLSTEQQLPRAAVRGRSL